MTGEPAGAVPEGLTALRDRVNIKCLHCGYCLPVCPSYQQHMEEGQSPRGRVTMLNEVLAGNLEFAETCEYFELCLGCRACEAACPKGLEYGEILRATRAALRRAAPPRGWRRAAEALVLRAARWRPALAALRWGAWAYQAARGPALARRTGLLDRAPAALAHAHAMLPPVPPPFSARLPSRIAPQGASKGRVALFRGCVQDALFRRTNTATARLLAAAGFEVVVPARQTCCGALADHAANFAAAAAARRNIVAFERSGADVVVSNAGGCGAMLKEYGALLRGEPAWGERAAAFAARVRDGSELLDGEGFAPAAGLPPGTVVTYQDSCHLANVQKVREAPRALLRRIPGATYVELEGAALCCGSAGTFWLSHPDLSLQILEGKVKAIEASGASVVVTTNPGCCLQLHAGLSRGGLLGRVRVVQLAELLWECCAPLAP